MFRGFSWVPAGVSTDFFLSKTQLLPKCSAPPLLVPPCPSPPHPGLDSADALLLPCSMVSLILVLGFRLRIVFP